MYTVYACTFSLRMAGWRPKNGRVGKLGFGGLLSGEGRGVMVMPPVSIIFIKYMYMYNVHISHNKIKG